MSENKNTFFRIRLSNVASHLEDAVTAIAFEHEASGVSEALKYSQPDLTYDPDIITRGSHDLDVFFQEKPSMMFFESIKTLNPNIQWQSHEEEHKDWLAEWKKGYEPFKLVGPYWVVPSWLEKPAAAEKVISIDPGMAFGTGTHATTKMAAYFVHRLAQEHSHLEDKTLLDVGTGTAILAMLARLEKIGTVVGLEIDPEARRVARENIQRNNLEDIFILDESLEELDEKFDFVVANIIDGVLINLRPHLLNCLKAGGDIFLTGILLEREETFMNKFIEPSGLSVIRRIEKDEWVGYWLRDRSLEQEK